MPNNFDPSTLPQYVQDQLPFDMGVDQTKPLTNNYLANNRFRFFLRRCPNITHFCQRISVPSLSFGLADQANPTGVDIRLPGTRYAFEDINVGFIVDENMKNWLEIYTWMTSLGIFTGSNEILEEKDKVSEAYMLITNSAYVPIIQVKFHNIFPVYLTGVDFDSTIMDTDPIISNATFAYTHYEIMPS